jgi:probable F420-dependent oxidoreductase
VRIGVVFPQTEIGADPGRVRAYADAVEGLGFRHLLAYDHVVGADPAVHQGWNGPYDIHSTFHEPLVLFGYLAALTSLELVSGVLVLPQRQTVLVSKQAAEADILSRGRLRLGIGIGWNAVEHEALGADFSTRGARLSEQVDLLRRLWTEDTVTFAGTHHTVTGAGLAPPPVQRPIPIWFGAHSPTALRRTGRLADGWFPGPQPGPRLDEEMQLVREAAEAADRDPSAIGMEARVNVTADNLDDLPGRARAWRMAGATHLSLNTMGAGFGGVDDHVAALGAAASALGELG